MNHSQRVVIAIGFAIGFALLGVALLPVALDQSASSGYLRGVGLFAVADVLWTAATVLLFEEASEDDTSD